MTRDSRTGTAIGSPAPGRHRVQWWIIAAALALAPAGWFLQLNASYQLGTARCPGAPPGPPVAVAHGAIFALGIAAFVLAVLALASAARVWSRTRAEAPGDHHNALTTGHGRTRFLALAGFIVSTIFLIAVVFALCVPLLVKACGA